MKFQNSHLKTVEIFFFSIKSIKIIKSCISQETLFIYRLINSNRIELNRVPNIIELSFQVVFRVSLHSSILSSIGNRYHQANRITRVR